MWQTRRGFGLIRHELWFLLLIIVGGLAYAVYDTGELPPFSNALRGTPLANAQFTVTDGDTIRIHGERKGTRLLGFNAPEISKPLCAAERELGLRATERLRELVLTCPPESGPGLMRGFGAF
jgi:endonuclease YncB( thermonuclease family)